MMKLDSLKFDEKGLIPAVVVDAKSEVEKIREQIQNLE